MNFFKAGSLVIRLISAATSCSISFLIRFLFSSNRFLSTTATIGSSMGEMVSDGSFSSLTWKVFISRGVSGSSARTPTNSPDEREARVAVEIDSFDCSP
jgi:hypothetical protein